MGQPAGRHALIPRMLRLNCNFAQMCKQQTKRHRKQPCHPWGKPPQNIVVVIPTLWNSLSLTDWFQKQLSFEVSPVISNQYVSYCTSTSSGFFPTREMTLHVSETSLGNQGSNHQDLCSNHCPIHNQISLSLYIVNFHKILRELSLVGYKLAIVLGPLIHTCLSRWHTNTHHFLHVIPPYSFTTQTTACCCWKSTFYGHHNILWCCTETKWQKH